MYLISEEDQLKHKLSTTTVFSYNYVCNFFLDCKQDELLYGKDYHWTFEQIERCFECYPHYTPFEIKEFIRPRPNNPSATSINL